VPISLVAEYPDMLEEYTQMKDQVEELSFDYNK
jgi:hypothetical protein